MGARHVVVRDRRGSGGADAVVIRDVGAGAMVVGNPSQRLEGR